LKHKILLFIDPHVMDFVKNPDALSQDFTIFKYGGRVNGRKAIEIMLELDENET